ncbi:BZ3500_MvSof-1268-A1-R1_Chr2-2g04738 [Microbotryum saponariae]|uniref:BZ3500_MvSof-1268-A1-R1_Chr2-2g04738 protein n=1 Tax=Microbotryum saponariae TaxID=289078 RepID=A0A2X0MZH4_9BASI|nr:BZ3500_MvSof-1268-A1-R1_Chr2-2g04738 [Microbotryum saponariae]SDA00042.1 BZ3501_MvSof-1269-A2-R1_Chr2-2g04412 [Microbotryum saponariae]
MFDITRITPPIRFLSDALVVPTFVLRSRPHPRNQGKTAIEVLLGKKPSLTHLQPFGSTAFEIFIEYNYHAGVQSSNEAYFAVPGEAPLVFRSIPSSAATGASRGAFVDVHISCLAGDISLDTKA